MQTEELACLPVGSEVSAKYKGAFCEAKVKKVHRQVKCRITFKQGLGSFTVCDTQIKGNISVGASIQAKHPEKSGFLDAVVNKIQDQSHYTVVFDDGDIATLRRNALCMKSGKHFNASESLDNLPLTHPEHFGTPVGSRRRGRVEEEEEESSEDEEYSQPYQDNIGRVVCVEISDKKMARAKENWFPGLIVAPNAQEIVKINTKEDFLVRSFKDHRFYTVPKKECKKFHRDTAVKSSADPAHTKAVENVIAFLDKDELPVHWDREVLFDMREDPSTEGSSEEDLTESGDEDNESTEEKDHLVAELYKHMDDRGTPINRTPSIGACDVDLYKLFKIVQRLGGQNRVTANNQWRQVAKKLGFETNWCANQVRVCYARYLHSFEEMYRTLGCTFINYPKSNNLRARHGSGRPLVRGARIKSKDQDGDKGDGDEPGPSGGKEKGDESSDQSSTTSQEDNKQGYGSDSAVPTHAMSSRSRGSSEAVLNMMNRGRKKKGWKRSVATPPEAPSPSPRGGGGGQDMEVDDNDQLELETEIVGDRGAATSVYKPGRKSAGNNGNKSANVFGRTRRDSSSSLSTASDVKSKKEEKSSKKNKDEQEEKPERGNKKIIKDEDEKKGAKAKKKDDKDVTEKKGKSDDDKLEGKVKGKKDDNEKTKGRGNEARSKSLAVEDIEKKLDDIDKKEEEQSKRGKDPAADQDENKDKERGRRSKLEDEPLEGRGKKKLVEVEEDRVVVGRGKVKEEEDSDGSGKPASNRGGRKKGRSKLLADEEDENTSDMDAALKDKDEKEKKKSLKKKVSSTAVNTTAAVTGPSSVGSTIASASSLGVAAPSSATAVKKTSSGKETGDEPQHLKNNVICSIGDKIKVFWLHGQIYDAKILKTNHPEGQKWPKFFVHYLGWNSRYDEWITRARIAQNETWNQSKGGKSAAPSSTTVTNQGSGPPDVSTSIAAAAASSAANTSTESISSTKTSSSSTKSFKGKPGTGKVKEDAKSDNENEEDNKLKDEDLDKTKKEDTPAKKKRLVKGRGTTPSSTPDSSRTSSPASTRAARSPTKQVSPSKDTDDQDETDDRANTRTSSPVTAAGQRTESPVTRKLKRQSSTAAAAGSVGAADAKPKAKSTPAKNDDEKMETDNIDTEEVNKEDKNKKECDDNNQELKRKSSRTGPTMTTPSSELKRRPNTPDKAAVDNKTAETKKETKTVLPANAANADNPRTSARLESKRPVTPVSDAKRPVTPSKKAMLPKDDDPYDFKEIEESTLKFEPTLKSTDSPTRAARIKEEAAKSRSVAEGAKLSMAVAVAADKSTDKTATSDSASPGKTDVLSFATGKVTPTKDSSKLPATAAARGRKKKVDETSTDDLPTTAGTSDKSSPEKDGEAKKEKAGSISPKADAKKESNDTPEKKVKSEDLKSVSKTKDSPPKLSSGQPLVALQRISTTSPSSMLSSTSSQVAPSLPVSVAAPSLPAMKPMTLPPNRFALFPHLASLSAGGGLNRPLPTVAPPLPPSTIQPLPTIAPSLPPVSPAILPSSAPPLQLSLPPSTVATKFLSPPITSILNTPATTTALSSTISMTSMIPMTFLSSTSTISTSLSTTASTTLSSLMMSTTCSTSLSGDSSTGSSTPLSTSSVIDAIVGTVIKTNLDQMKKEKDEIDVKPTLTNILPLESAKDKNSQSTSTPPPSTSNLLGIPTKQENKDTVKTEIKQETEDSDGNDTKNNSDTDDANSGDKKSDAARRGEKRHSSLDNATAAAASGVSPRKTRKRQKLRGPRNYNLKSREVVSDTDSDSSEAGGDSATKHRPVPPKRRKTVESAERRKAAAAAQHQESGTGKITEDSDIDKSLVCREIIERSPEMVNAQGNKYSEHQKRASANKSGGDDSSELDLESLTGSPKRVGSDLESLTTTRSNTRADRQGDGRGGNTGHKDSDVESVTGSSRRAGSVDSRGGMDSSSDTRSGRGKRKRGGASGMDISPIDMKKKRRSRDSVGRGRGKGRGGRASGSNSNNRGRQDGDDGSETGGNGVTLTPTIMGTRSRTDFEMTKLVRLDNAALEALAQPKPNASSKYNFYVKLEPGMDSGARIGLLQGALEDLRKTYLTIKSELSALERRRKKIRKKKEQRSNTTELHSQN